MFTVPGRCLRGCKHRTVDPITDFEPIQPLLSFLYPKWYTTSLAPFPGTVESRRYVDLSATWHYHSSTDINQDSPTESKVNIALRKALHERWVRLPRARFRVQSANDAGLAEKISHSPSYRTARKSLEENNGPAKGSGDSRARVLRKHRRTHVNRLPLIEQLAKNTTMDDAPDSIVELSDDFILHYTGSLRPNMWLQTTGSGSYVRVSSASKEEPKEGYRRICLYGSPRAVELAEESLLQLQSAFQIDSRSSDELESSNDKAQDPPTKIDSVASFTRHIFRLTNSQVRRSSERETGLSFHQYTAFALVQAFSNPLTSIYSSTVALDRALAWLRKCTDLERIENLLHQRAKALKLHMDCTSYNLLLSSALARRNHPKVKQLVTEMQNVGIQPNSRTWATFFVESTTQEERLRILEIMNSTGVELPPSVSAILARPVLQAQLHRLRKNPDAFWDVIRAMDDTFAAAWLNESTLLTMKRFCSRQNMNKTLGPKILQLATQRNVNINTVTTADFLLLKSKPVEESLNLLGSAVAQGIRLDTPKVISALFDRAWADKYANTCRVLWCYAVTNQMASYTMRSKVAQNIVRNIQNEEESGRSRKDRILSRLVIGTDLDMTGFSSVFPRLQQRFGDTENPIEELGTSN